MFELNDKVDITLVSEIGAENRNALIIDNFYKDPDSIREYAFSCNLQNRPNLMSGLPGWRIYEEDSRVRENLKPTFDNLKNQSLWVTEIDEEKWEENWNKTNFLCNVMNSTTRDPGGGYPHMDAFDMHFGAVIYLNTPEECNGGTRLYSMSGKQSTRTLQPGISHLFNEHAKNKWQYDQEDDWEVELEFEMVYNRCILYEADQLHAQWYSEDAFTTTDRLAQVLFI